MNRLIFIRILCSVSLGFCWNGSYQFLAAAVLFPVVIYYSSSRLEAFLLALLYFLCATRGLIFGSIQYFNSGLFLGVGIWISGNLILSLIYSILWTKSSARRVFQLFLALLLTAFPPIGAIGWAHPMLAAGVIFPGWGWWGVFMTLALIFLLMKKPVQVTLLTVCAVFFAQFSPDPKRKIPFSGIRTHYQYDQKRDFLSDYFRQEDLVKLAKKSEAEFILLPEFSGGVWTDATRDYWQKSLDTGQSVFLGVEEHDETGRFNAIADTKSGQIIYHQRQPIPLSMWKPWSEESFKADWFKNPVSIVREKKIAFLICYESLLIWPALHSLSGSPDALAVTGNYWWAKNTSIPGIMESGAISWSRLFSIPLIMGINF